MNKKLLRSLGALLAGFFAVVIVTLATDILLHAIGVFPPWGQPTPSAPLVLATVYRTVYGVAGSYLMARLAPDKPMQHALVGGGVGLILSTVGAVVTWNRGPAFGPHWYPLALIALAMPQAWLGGLLHRRGLFQIQ